MNDVPDPVSIETYMRGECHIHAIAAVRQHGGRFAICYDDSEPYFTSDEGEGDVSSVVHVWAILQGPDGPIARDVIGDIELHPDDMKAHISDFFPGMDVKFDFNDAWIDTMGTLEEIEALSGCDDHTPLFPVREEDVAIASALPSVTTPPGLNPAPKGAMAKAIEMFSLLAGGIQRKSRVDYCFRDDDVQDAFIDMGALEDGEVYITDIVVPEENRGEGRASHLLDRLVAAADTCGVTLSLSISPDDGPDDLDASALVGFYRRRGFRLQPGGMMHMSRAPKDPEDELGPGQPV